MGRARSGKDSVAAMVQRIQPAYKLQRISAPLKEAAGALYGIDYSVFDCDAKDSIDPRYGKTPRQLLHALMNFTVQQHGAEHFSRRLWLPRGSRLIVPDVRYLHDVDAVRRAGGVIWKIDRPVLRLHHNFEDHLDAIQPDATIVNDGSLHELKCKVVRMLLSYT